MIPTPAKRLSHQPLEMADEMCEQHPSECCLRREEAKEEEEAEERRNRDEEDGHDHEAEEFAQLQEEEDMIEDDEEGEFEEEEEEEDYMRLDTIVEEDECPDDESAIPDHKSPAKKPTATNQPQAEGFVTNHNSKQFVNSHSLSLRKFSSISSNNNNQPKMQHQRNDAAANSNNKNANTLPLPSTNRLISEHQARQKQALFRVLAERQKLMDELDPSERVDLMSSHIINNRKRSKSHHSRRRLNDRRVDDDDDDDDDDDGVPLSAVDLTSMSDRMLDELLGNIASASSSSLSSNAESLESSDISATSSCDEEQLKHHNHHHHQQKQQQQQQQQQQKQQQMKHQSDKDPRLRSTPTSGSFNANSSSSGIRSSLNSSARSSGRSSNDAPNVIGVHEDERTRASARKNCRDSHKLVKTYRHDHDDDDNNDEDDDNNDHELVVHLNNSGDLSDSLSSPCCQQQAEDYQSQSASSSSKLEEYFTSGLVNPHEFSAPATTAEQTDDLYSDINDGRDASGQLDEKEEQQQQQQEQEEQNDESVEEVLAKMLEALHEIGTDNQEQLNRLLERGFAHLEQLLNCSLNPNQQQPQPQQTNRSQNLAQKMISPNTTTTLSKDSDYGSDTQSAECLSHATGNGTTTSSDSPSPVSLGNSANKQQQSVSSLSPLAIELSFKLAESLHRLAQQQQQRHKSRDMEPEATSTTTITTTAAINKKAPMKSIVMINSGQSARSPSVASSSSSLDLATNNNNQQRNPTPSNDELSESSGSSSRRSSSLSQATAAQKQQRQQFKTCVDISSNGEVRVISSSSSSNATQESEAIKKQSDKEEEEETIEQATSIVHLKQSAVSEVKQQPAPELVRRRSGRSSLRRRPSFTGSSTGVRPGSPVPRLAGMFAASADSDPSRARAMMESPSVVSKQEASSELHHQKQGKHLQRVLIMAQKYNYSPAKLAASRLSSKLQLRDLTGEVSAGIYLDGSSPVTQATFEQKTQEQDTRKRIIANKQNRMATTTSEPIKITGQVQLDISYFAKSGSLTVHVIQCSQLAPVGKRRTTSNPYVKLYLLPDKSKSGKRKSITIKNELNPEFNQKFTFGPIQLIDFDGRILWLSVWHKDRLGRNEFLGEIFLPLSQVRNQLFHSDLCQSTSPKWYQLRDKLASPSLKQPVNQLNGHRQSGCIRQNQRIARAPTDISNNQGDYFTNITSDGRQVELVDKLSELQKKAALLRTTVAPSGDLRLNQTPTDIMQVFSGPAPERSPSISGKLFVALKFVPEGQELLPASSKRTSRMVGELHVNIKEAHNIGGFESPTMAAVMACLGSQTSDSLLSNNDDISSSSTTTTLARPPSGSLPNPFCKCYLLASNGQRVAKQKTPHLKKTSNPRWDHKCVFNSVKLSNLSSQAIEILMFNRDSILVSNNEFLGGIRLCRSKSDQNNSDNNNQQDEEQQQHQESYALCTERESRLWNQMLVRPNIWVYGELDLRQLGPLVARC